MPAGTGARRSDVSVNQNDPNPSREFDGWAATYDSSVAIDYFPFSGYESVLEKTAALAEVQPGLRLLDLGTGTGNLALKFDQTGCELWATDFSPVMLEMARRKLTQAHLVLYHLRRDWPAELPVCFDRILSAYVFHHFELDEKVCILQALSSHLAPEGRIVIADISFPDEAAREQVKVETGETWEDESYWIAAQSLPALERAGFKVEYIQGSECAGVFTLPTK